MSQAGKFDYFPGFEPSRGTAVRQCDADDYSVERKGDFHA